VLFLQFPIDPKAWNAIGPVALGIIAVLVTLAAIAIAFKKAGIIGPGAMPAISSNGKSNGKSGDMSTPELELRIEKIFSAVLEKTLEKQVESHLEKLRETNHSINDHLGKIVANSELVRMDIKRFLEGK
jgi:hypothetical protein